MLSVGNVQYSQHLKMQQVGLGMLTWVPLPLLLLWTRSAAGKAPDLKATREQRTLLQVCSVAACILLRSQCQTNRSQLQDEREGRSLGCAVSKAISMLYKRFNATDILLLKVKVPATAVDHGHSHPKAS
jgi:hypothetical protein